MAKITWGADPEFFLVDKDKNLVPAFAVAEALELGTKRDPRLFYADFVGVLADGAAIEFNLAGPLDEAASMWGYLNEGITVFDAVLSDHGLERIYTRDWYIPKQYLEHPEMQQIGCDPDQDAYAGGSKRLDINPDTFKDGGGVWRGAGGHIHIGIDPWPEIPKHVFVQLLDFIFMAVAGRDGPGSLHDKIYRRLGLYREKPYGIEYRTPASWWVADYGRFAKFASTVEGLVRILDNPGSPTFMELLNLYKTLASPDMRPRGALYIHKHYLHAFERIRQLSRDVEPQELELDMDAVLENVNAELREQREARNG